jgi:hypothetical protein
MPWYFARSSTWISRSAGTGSRPRGYNPADVLMPMPFSHMHLPPDRRGAVALDFADFRFNHGRDFLTVHDKVIVDFDRRLFCETMSLMDAVPPCT